MYDLITYLCKIVPRLQFMPYKCIQAYVVETILSTPYKRASLEQIYEIVRSDYYPGLFHLNERKYAPDFLLEENNVSFKQWLVDKFNSEMAQLSNSTFLRNIISKVGINVLIKYSIGILDFKIRQGVRLLDLIVNQEYSDIFRRIVMLLLTGNPFFIYNNHLDFNLRGKEAAISILQMTQQYGFRSRLFQAIASGMIGMDIKERNISTSPVSLSCNLDLDVNKLEQLVDDLNTYINHPTKIGIDCYSDYYREVILGKDIHITWFTDDYIETIFELKFIEEQMNANRSLYFTIVPRYDTYSNDASYNDIIEFLSINELAKLKTYYDMGRLIVCKEGMDISTIDFFRMSEVLYKTLKNTDICVISGARAFEMTQGLKKTVYYTGIAVCKSYTESITGFSRDSGKLVFLRQDAGEFSFTGFRDRAWRRMKDNDQTIPVAGMTAKEYYQKKYANSEC